MIGGSAELGESAINVVLPIRDGHITLLDLPGLDGNKPTYFHGGRGKQLSQFGDLVISELQASKSGRERPLLSILAAGR